MCLFRDQLLPFGTEAARRHAELAAKAKYAGTGFSVLVGHIATMWTCDFSLGRIAMRRLIRQPLSP
jgi:hypothetical protein